MTEGRLNIVGVENTTAQLTGLSMRSKNCGVTMPAHLAREVRCGVKEHKAEGAAYEQFMTTDDPKKKSEPAGS